MDARPQLRKRRSLLALAREKRGAMPLWRILLITNGILLLLIVLSWLIRGGELPLRTLPVVALMAAAYCTPITILAYYGSTVVSRFTGGMSRAARGALLALAWLMSGMIGSLLAHAAIHYVGGGQSYPGFIITPMLVGNGVVAIAIGAFIFLFELMRGRFERRSALLGQQDLLAAELLAARNVQRSLLPAEDVAIPGFDISGLTEPAVEVGGDYYDYLSFADGTKGILVADAAGKGVPAALVMAKFQGMAQALSMRESSPAAFLVGLNDTLRIRLDRHSFITVGMLTIDLDDRCGFYRAGHNPLLYYRSATGAIDTCRPDGMALGLAINTNLKISFEPEWLPMDPGDVALLYSDGLTEATNGSGEAFGEERVMDALRISATADAGAAAIRGTIMKALADFVGDAEPHDDITVVVVKRNRVKYQ